MRALEDRHCLAQEEVLEAVTDLNFRLNNMHFSTLREHDLLARVSARVDDLIFRVRLLETIPDTTDLSIGGGRGARGGILGSQPSTAKAEAAGGVTVRLRVEILRFPSATITDLFW